jgi:ferredoxin-NADP reductase
MKKCTIIASRIHEGILYLTIKPKKEIAQFTFQAGQYAAISFKSQNKRKSPVRCFSVVSSATDTRNIEFAIRLLGDFTHALSVQPIGTTVYLQGPYGQFCVDERQDRRLVLLAGGIGITPCLSIIRTASELNVKLPILLLYSNRSGSHIPFQTEIKELQAKNKYFKAVFFVTDRTTVLDESRQMLSGRISSEHIKKVVSDSFAGSTYFICGPKQFMDATETMLLNENVGENQIVAESFTQSSKTSFATGLNALTATYVFSAALLVFMISGIAYLDLSRYVPAAEALSADQSPAKTTQATTTATSKPSSTSTTATPAGSSSTSTGSNSGSGSDSISSGSSPTTNDQTTSTNSSSSSSNSTATTQSPVSSVS